MLLALVTPQGGSGERERQTLGFWVPLLGVGEAAEKGWTAQRSWVLAYPHHGSRPGSLLSSRRGRMRKGGWHVPGMSQAALVRAPPRGGPPRAQLTSLDPAGTSGISWDSLKFTPNRFSPAVP